MLCSIIRFSKGDNDHVTFSCHDHCHLHPFIWQAKSGKELVGFLFNDFLLLTQPQQSLGSMASVFSFDMKTDTQFKIYRNVSA